MKMKHLVERCEAEVDEDYTAAQNLASMAMMAVPAALAASWPLASLGMNAVHDMKDRRASAAQRNHDAERCHAKGGKDCRCADGFDYDSSAKKCVKNTGSGIKRFFKKK